MEGENRGVAYVPPCHMAEGPKRIRKPSRTLAPPSSVGHTDALQTHQSNSTEIIKEGGKL